MTATTYNTLTSSDELRTAGFTEQQVTAQLKVIYKALDEKNENLEMRLERLATKDEMKDMQINLIKEMKDTQISLIKWMVGLLSVTIGLLKFFH